MKVLITGGRFFYEKSKIERFIASLSPDTVVIHGACRTGADKYADELARQYGLEVIPVPADWSKGPRGGPDRNQVMVDMKPDRVVGFWDGLSTGTRDCLYHAFHAGLKCSVIPADGMERACLAGVQEIVGNQPRLPL